MPALSVLIPVYNEKPTLGKLLERVRAVPVDLEIILIDDGSTDGSREEVEAAATVPGIRAFFHEKNRGKGAAVRTGLSACSGDIVIIQDADLEYFPEEYPDLIAPIRKGLADVVYGSRFKGQANRALYFHHYLANRSLTIFSDFFTNLHLTDMLTCYKVFRRDLIQSIPLREDRFGFDPEVTAKIARRRCRVFEVPISYYGRTHAEGKKVHGWHAFNAAYCIIRYSIAD